MCDRSLATAVLFDQCPQGEAEAAVRVLAECPPEMGFSYPANAGWRLWALGKGGRADVIVKDFRERWANMESVLLNNTLQEDWHALPDSSSRVEPLSRRAALRHDNERWRESIPWLQDSSAARFGRNWRISICWS